MQLAPHSKTNSLSSGGGATLKIDWDYSGSYVSLRLADGVSTLRGRKLESQSKWKAECTQVADTRELKDLLLTAISTIAQLLQDTQFSASPRAASRRKSSRKSTTS